MGMDPACAIGVCAGPTRHPIFSSLTSHSFSLFNDEQLSQSLKAHF